MNIMLIIPVLVAVVGAYLCFKVGFFFLNPKRMLRDIAALLSRRGAVKNLSLALAGTLGVGNIVGVAVGIRIGGAGSVFWLMLSAIPAAAIKYAESSLALDSCGRGVIDSSKRAFPRIGRVLSPLYAVFVLALALAMGAGLQSASFASTFSALLPVSELTLGVALMLLALPFVLFGVSRVKDATALFVSAASLVYIALAGAVIFISRENVPSAVRAVFEGAFRNDAALGGFLGALSSRALKEGFLRGILSNEAGLGTSSLAHSEDSEYTPHEAGVVGVLEVFADTLVLCPLTALMLLAAGDTGEESAVGYVLSAVRVGGAVAEYLFAAALFFFAFSTVICWGTYGRTACLAFAPRLEWLFRAAFLAAVAVGAVLGAEALVGAVDVIMLPLAVISLLTVIKGSDRAAALSECGKHIKEDVFSREP